VDFITKWSGGAAMPGEAIQNTECNKLLWMESVKNVQALRASNFFLSANVLALSTSLHTVNIGIVKVM
jgi:hypothetical protein